MAELDKSPVCAADIKEWTYKDPIMYWVLWFITHGWPYTVTEREMIPFYRKREELSTEDSSILWGSRVVIPPPGRTRLLKELHEIYLGITCMKFLAHGFIWWPGIDADIELEVRSCEVCQLHQHGPPFASVHSWQWPSSPRSRLHVDYSGHFIGWMFLIIIDTHSKWMDVHMLSTSYSFIAIEKIRHSCFGIPKVLVSDNGTSFTSKDFQLFLAENGVVHRRTAPYHPASNGIVERAVQTLKSGLKKLTGPLGDKTNPIFV